jgi:hypothetical protein
MPQKYRQLLFYTFMLGFLISAPLILLYTAGYRYHPSLGKIVKTGVVSVTTIPKNATVIIDGEKQNQKTPATIDNVHATEHSIRAEKEGYFPWEKTLPVASNQTTFAEDIVLFADIETKLLQTIDISELFVSPSHLQAIYTIQEGAYRELWHLEQDEKNATLLARVPASPTDSATLTWSSQEHYALLTTTLDAVPHFLVISTTKSETIEITEKQVQDAWWDQSEEPTLYLRTEDTLLAFDLESESTDEITFSAQTLTSTNDGYYYISENTEKTTLAHYTESDLTPITYLPLGDYRFMHAPSDKLLLHERNHNRLILIDPNTASEPILINTEATSWQWWGHYDLLYSDGYSLNRFNTGSYTTDTFLRLSEKITDSAWHPFGTYVFYVQTNALHVMELDDRDVVNTYLLADEIDLAGFWMDEKATSLQFFGKTDDLLYGHHERLLEK